MMLAGGHAFECPLCAEWAMAPMLAVLLHADQEPELGAWCPHCLLPSAASFGITARCEHGWPLTLAITPLLVCLDCGQHLGAPTGLG